MTKRIAALCMVAVLMLTCVAGVVTVSAASLDGSKATFDLTGTLDQVTMMFRDDPYDVVLTKGDNNATRFTATADTANGSDPYIVLLNPTDGSSNLGVNGTDAAYILMKYKTDAESQDQPEVAFNTNLGNGILWGHWDAVAKAPLQNDGSWHYVLVDASETFGKYPVELYAFRIDPLDKAVAGEYIDIATVKFFDNDNTAWDYLESIAAADTAAAEYITVNDEPAPDEEKQGRPFEEVGRVNINWIADYTGDLCFDGELDEWEDMGIQPIVIDETNMVVWNANNVPIYQNPDVIPDEFEITAYIAADANYFYMAVSIVDYRLARGTSLYDCNGDAFQIAVDWNQRIETAMDQGAGYQSNTNTFYTFSCSEYNEPLRIRVQSGARGGNYWISEYTSTNYACPEMKGAATPTNNGWTAEFCLSWDQLYSDFEVKTWEAMMDKFDENNPFSLGLSMCYMDRNYASGPIVWAAGTFDTDETYPTITPEGNGIEAVLTYEEGRTLNCQGIGDTEFPHSHVYGGWITEMEATCTEGGSRKRVCVCGNVETQTTAALGHKTSGWRTVEKATCTRNGLKQLVCRCGKVDTKVVPATGHDLSEWETVREIDCTTAGLLRRTCSNCELIEEEEFSAIGHIFSEWEEISEATCIEDGVRGRFCWCGRMDVEVITATGHSFGEWVVVHEGSATENGLKMRLCGCGEIETQVIVTMASSETETETATDTDTEAPTDTEAVSENASAQETSDQTADSTTSDESETEKADEAGCKSVVGGLGLLVISVAAVIVLGKKRDA